MYHEAEIPKGSSALNGTFLRQIPQPQPRICIHHPKSIDISEENSAEILRAFHPNQVGVREEPIQAGQESSALEEQWIYSTSLGNPATSNTIYSSEPGRPVYSPAENRLNIPQALSVIPSSLTSPSTSESSSWATRVIEWAYNKLPSMSFSRSNVTFTIPKGAQPATAKSSTPLDQHGSPTELAFVSSKGLRTLIRSPIETSDTHHLVPISDEMEGGDSDSSYWSTKSGKREHKGFRYEAIKCDIFTILRRLKLLDFYERLPNKPSKPALPLLDQISAYLSRSPNNPSLVQIRWLVLSGHNSNNEEFLIDRRMSFKWLKLRSLLKATPRGVVVVLLIACCEAEKAAREVIDNLRVPQFVVLASSAAGEQSLAAVGTEEQFHHGDNFISAMFKVLKDKNMQQQSTDTWEGALRLIAQELWKTSREQHPLFCVKTNLPPSRIFRDLTKTESSSAGQRGRSLPTTKGSDLSTNMHTN